MGWSKAGILTMAYADKDVKQQEIDIAGGNAKMQQLLWTQLEVSYKTKYRVGQK